MRSDLVQGNILNTDVLYPWRGYTNSSSCIWSDAHMNYTYVNDFDFYENTTAE